MFRRAVLFGDGDSVLVGIEDPGTNLMILKIDQMATTGLVMCYWRWWLMLGGIHPHSVWELAEEDIEHINRWAYIHRRHVYILPGHESAISAAI